MTVDIYDSRRKYKTVAKAIYCETAIVGSQVTSKKKKNVWNEMKICIK